MVYKILEDIANDYGKGVATASWVDDVVQRSEGRRKQVVATLLAAGVAFAKSVTESCLEIARQSALIASNTDIAKEFQQEFAKRNIKITAKHVAADLGIHRGQVPRARPKHAKRSREARSMMTKTKKTQVYQQS